MEGPVVTECVSEFEGPRRALPNSGLIRADSFEQQFRSKLEHCAIIATINRMRHTIRFGLVEEQDVILIGNELTPCDPLQKHTRARKDNVMPARMFFRAMLPALRAAADVVNRHAPAAIKRLYLQAHQFYKVRVPSPSRRSREMSRTHRMESPIPFPAHTLNHLRFEPDSGHLEISFVCLGLKVRGEDD